MIDRRPIGKKILTEKREKTRRSAQARRSVIALLKKRAIAEGINDGCVEVEVEGGVPAAFPL